jgi:YfiH family protein
MAVFLDEADGLKCYRFPLLAAFPALAHGIFTRQGGVSAAPYASLNLSFAVGDRPGAVRENRRRVQRALGLAGLASAAQVHGRRDAEVTQGNATPEKEIPEADILITRQPGVGLLIKQADCQAVLLYDPKRRVVANVHCGWRGQVQDILAAAVSRLQKDFGCRPAALYAAIGPGLGPCCAEFKNYRREFPENLWIYQVRPHYFDLWQLSQDQLTAAGLPPDHIETVRLCTRCRSEEFFSYRRDGTTGRQGAVIALKA